MNTVGTCPICKIPLTVNSDHKHVQFCSKCRREYYPVEPNKQQPPKIQHEDLIAVSEGETEASPILLVQDENLNASYLRYREQEKDKKNYLRRHFPNAKITSRFELPT